MYCGATASSEPTQVKNPKRLYEQETNHTQQVQRSLIKLTAIFERGKQDSKAYILTHTWVSLP